MLIRFIDIFWLDFIHNIKRQCSVAGDITQSSTRLVFWKCVLLEERKKKKKKKNNNLICILMNGISIVHSTAGKGGKVISFIFFLKKILVICNSFGIGGEGFGFLFFSFFFSFQLVIAQLHEERCVWRPPHFSKDKKVRHQGLLLSHNHIDTYERLTFFPMIFSW